VYITHHIWSGEIGFQAITLHCNYLNSSFLKILPSLNGGALGPALVHTKWVTTLWKGAFLKIGLEKVFDLMNADQRATFLCDLEGLSGDALSEACRLLKEEARRRAQECSAIRWGGHIPENDQMFFESLIHTYKPEALWDCFSYVQNDLWANVKDLLDRNEPEDLLDPEVSFSFLNGGSNRYSFNPRWTGEYAEGHKNGCRGLLFESWMIEQKETAVLAEDKAKIAIKLVRPPGPQSEYRGAPLVAKKYRPYIGKRRGSGGSIYVGGYTLEADGAMAYDMLVREVGNSQMDTVMPGRNSGFNFDSEEQDILVNEAEIQEKWRQAREAEIHRRAAEFQRRGITIEPIGTVLNRIREIIAEKVAKWRQAEASRRPAKRSKAGKKKKRRTKRSKVGKKSSTNRRLEDDVEDDLNGMDTSNILEARTTRSTRAAVNYFESDQESDEE
jgi:hypothetical protein